MKLLFIYNAKSNNISSLLGIAHKIISPKTYPCSLCKLTHGYFKEREIWSRFRKELDLEIQFYHLDEIDFGDNNKELPVILSKDYRVLISAKELKNMKTTETLINRLKELT